MLGGLVEAEADQDPRRPRRRRMGVDRVQPLVDLAEPVGIVAVLGLVEQSRALDIGGEHGLERGRAAARRVLGDIADPAAPRHAQLAGVGIEHPGDDPHQGRLARPVAPDQPDPPARRQRRRSAVEDRPPAEADNDVGQVEHGRAQVGSGGGFRQP